MAHTTLQFGKVIWVEHFMLTCVYVFVCRKIVGSVSSCAPVQSIVWYHFFSLGIPLCHFFSVAQYFVAFESICCWQICDFFSAMLYTFFGLTCLITSFFLLIPLPHPIHILCVCAIL